MFWKRNINHQNKQDFNDKPYSKAEADIIFAKFINIDNKDRSAHNIFLNGGWGTGKSTIKEILIDKIKSECVDTKLVVFDAVQAEENSQVTSDFYYTISKAFSRWNLLDLMLRNKFRAIAHLKKESNSSNLSTSIIMQLLIFGMVSFFVTKLSKAEWLNEILTLKYGFNVSGESAFNNKLLLLFLFLIGLFLCKDKVLVFISARLPRVTHVEILRKVSLWKIGWKKQFPFIFKKPFRLIILVDEIDRINKDAAKLLLHEILIIRETLNYRDNNRIRRETDCSIFLFSLKEILNTIYEDECNGLSQEYSKKHFDLKRDIRAVSMEDEIIKSLNGCFADCVGSVNLILKPLIQYLEEYLKTFRDVLRYDSWLKKEITIEEIDRIIIVFGDSYLVNSVKNNESQKKQIILIGRILSIYIISSDSFGNNGELKNAPIKELILWLFISLRNNSVFKNILLYIDKINFKLNSLENELQKSKKIDRLIRDILAIGSIYLKSTKGAPTYYLHCEDNNIKRVLNQLDQESAKEVLQIIGENKATISNNGYQNNQIEDSIKIKELDDLCRKNKYLMQVVERKIKILQIFQDVTKVEDYSEKTLHNLIEENAEFDEEFFGEDFKEISLLIMKDVEFYLEQNDIYLGDDGFEVANRFYVYLKENLLKRHLPGYISSIPPDCH